MGNSKSKKDKPVPTKKALEGGVRDSRFSMGLGSKKFGDSWKQISVENFEVSQELPPLKKQETMEYDDLPPPPKAKPTEAVAKELAEVSAELEVFLLKIDPSSLGNMGPMLESFKLDGREGLNEFLLSKYGQNLDEQGSGSASEKAKKPVVPPRLAGSRPGEAGKKGKLRRPSALPFQGAKPTVNITGETEATEDDESDDESDDDNLLRKKSSIVPPFAEKARESSLPEFMRPSTSAVRKKSAGSGPTRRTSQVSAHSRKHSVMSAQSRQHSVMSGQSENIGGEVEDVKKDPRRPTKFGKAILPQQVMAEFAQKGSEVHRKVSGVERKVSMQKQRKLSFMSQESTNIEGGAGPELQQKLAHVRKMSMQPPNGEKEE